jgi:hypothetical protein
MKLPAKLAIASLAIVTAASSASAQNATTDPVGFVTMNITAGLGTSKRTTQLSIPLLDTATITGQATGRITGISSSTISNSAAGWSAGELSVAATPYLIQITSGNATGRMFVISTSTNNTASTVTLSSEDVANTDLTTLGIAVGDTTGDTYSIHPCDTLSSIFGTPESTGIQGGTSASQADTIVMFVNGVSSTYYYNTSLVRWTRDFIGNPTAANTPVRPYTGVRYLRLPATPVQLTSTGSVPTEIRQLPVKNSGATLVSAFYPVDSTLGALGIQNIAGWQSGATASVSDKVIVFSAGSSKTFFYNGTNWIRDFIGSPISNNESIPAGSTITLNKIGAASGFSTYSQNVPYTLN